MLRSRVFRYVLVGVAALLVLLAAWVAWVAWQVNKDLSAAVDHANAIKAAVEAGDQDAIDAELSGLRDASAEAADGTSGTTWALLTKVPWFGDDAEGVEVTSRVLADLANDGVQPLAEVSDRLDQLLPRDGRVDMDAIAKLQEPIGDAHDAFAAADEELAALDSSGYTGRLKAQFDDFRDQVSQADQAMRVADTTAQLLPSMMGGDEPRTYLLAFQNNAELRATGGLIGAVAELSAENGKVSIVRQLSGGSFGRAETSALPLTEAEKTLYTDAYGKYFVNAGMAPDMPRAADLMRASWQERFPASTVDGVIMVDTVAMSYLLDATGPVTVDGVRITGDNLVDELLHNTYVRLAGDGVAQDEFFAAVASATFDKFTTDLSDGTAVIRALSRAGSQGRILLHSFDADEQAKINGTKVAGEFATDPDAENPSIDLTFHDGTGSKMSYYLRTEVDVNATYCSDDVQGYAMKVRLQSVAPSDAARLPDDITGGANYGVPRGNQIVTVRLFGPVGGEIGDLDLNAKQTDMIRVDHQGRPVGMAYVELEPGETVDLAWTLKSGSGQTGDTQVKVTPTIESADTVRNVSSACR